MTSLAKICSLEGLGGDERGQNTRRLAKAQLKGGEPSRLILGSHNVETDSWKGMSPPFLIPFDVETNGLYHCFISTFTGAISLGVERQRALMLHTSQEGKVFPKM